MTRALDSGDVNGGSYAVDFLLASGEGRWVVRSINAGATIDAVTVHAGVMPCSLAHGRYAGHDTRHDFRQEYAIRRAG